MMPLARLLRRLQRDQSGSILVESAFIMPTLAMMSIGTYQVSAMVARQSELQSAVAEAAQIALASKPDQASERTAIQNVIMTSTGLPANKVTVANKFRCGAATTVLDSSSTCATGVTVITYLLISVSDTYTPFWTDFGVANPVQFRVNRMVIVA